MTINNVLYLSFINCYIKVYKITYPMHKGCYYIYTQVQ